MGESSGIRLSPEKDDVQFVISGGQETGDGNWRLIMVRAPTVALLRTRLDALIKG